MKGALERKKYAKYLNEKRFLLLYNAIDKLSLDPEDPYDTCNYRVFAWYDLIGERIVFNITKLLNKKQFYTAKISYPLPEDTTVKLFTRDVKAFAISKVALMYLEKGKIQFKIG